jgi:hypothetical protein
VTKDQADRLTGDVIDTLDARGRRLKVRLLTALDRMRLCLLVGAEAAENAAYMLYASLASSLDSLDGEPAPIASLRALEALVQRLDEDGLEAILEAWIQCGWASRELDPQPDTPEARHAKNGSRRPTSA